MPEDEETVEEPTEEPIEEPEPERKPTTASVTLQILESELKMTPAGYEQFKSEHIDWGDKAPQMTQGMKVAHVVDSEVTWRMNIVRRDAAEDGINMPDGATPTTPTGNYLNMLLWLSQVKNKWVATPKFIPVLRE